MSPFESAQDEFTEGTSDLESGLFELEPEQEFDGEIEAEFQLSEIEEMELAAELLAVSNEEELDQFLGKLFKGIGKGLKKFGKFMGRSVLKPLGGLLKGIAKKALPFIGGALGSLIPIPGVGTALGSAIGGAASKLLEVELEGVSPEDQEFELARRFVRLASQAAARAADFGDLEQEVAAGGNLQDSARQAALAAVQDAARHFNSSRRGPSRRREQSGRWQRRGNRIVLLGA